MNAPEPTFEPVAPDGRAGAESEPVLRLGISACLLGHEVRFNGGHKRDLFLLKTLGRYVTWYPVCPEVEIGLGTPRESLRLVGEIASPRLVAPRSGSDHTEKMESWGSEKLGEIASWHLHGFVLKRASPSCGLFRVRVYNEKGMPDQKGQGLFARDLTRRFPLLPVEEEGRLHDPPLRENFIERIFAYERWSRLMKEDPTPGGLVRFHTAHKLTVLSHSPKHYRELGPLVAKAGTIPWKDLTLVYSETLAAGLKTLATRGKHTNVMHHLLGFLKDRLDPRDKKEVLGLIEDYRQGLLPLVVPLTLLKHHLLRDNVPEWVDQQVYLNPYPKELMLRNHV